MRRLFIILALKMAGLGVLRAEDSYIEYSIPKTADKYGPISTRDSEVTYIKYFKKGARPDDREAIVGVEHYRKEALMKRDLYKDGKLHGIQREWHDNGKLAMESPHKMGKMHGIFKEYNNLGQLISMYQMVEGNGQKIIFNDNGSLKHVDYYSGNEGNGWSLDFYENGSIKTVNKKEDGSYIAKYNAAFHEDGSIYIVALSNELNPRSAIVAYYDKSGELNNLTFLVRGLIVTREEYQKASRRNEAIPEILVNPGDYKNYLNEEIKVLIKKYKKLDLVSIPLKFNEDGLIITVTGHPFILPN